MLFEFLRHLAQNGLLAPLQQATFKWENQPYKLAHSGHKYAGG